jgi:hypothetical protein
LANAHWLSLPSAFDLAACVAARVAERQAALAATAALQWLVLWQKSWVGPALSVLQEQQAATEAQR